MQGFQLRHVQRYYDENTRLLLSLGQGSEGTIHRAVWGPGVKDRREAMAYPDQLVLERLKRLLSTQAVPEVVDLGSGVCASLCRLARSLPIKGTGITVSRAQVELAGQRIAAAGLTGSVRCIHGNFCNLPAELPPADLAFAIESFVHAPSATDFFRECGRLVRPGGYLLICDDFLTAPEPTLPATARHWIERARRGWVMSSLLDAQAATGLAAEAGFAIEESLDLSPYLELGRPRDYAIAALMRGFGWLPSLGSYWSMLYGGHALQICLRRSWIKHLFLVYRRR